MGEASEMSAVFLAVKRLGKSPIFAIVYLKGVIIERGNE